MLRLFSRRVFPPLPVIRTRLLSSSSTTTTPPPPPPPPAISPSSPVVRFLVDSCGLPLPSALSTAQSLPLKGLHKYHSVLDLLKSHGFSPSQIAAFIARRPHFLRSRSDRTLRPKLSFLLSEAGVPPADLPSLILSNPSLLSRGLDFHLRPTFHLLRCFLPSVQDLLLVNQRYTWFLTCNIRGHVAPNIDLLLARGVPRDHIAKLLTSQPRTLTALHGVFADAIDTVAGMGIDPKHMLFVYAVRVVNGMMRSTWRSRLEMLREMGWSAEQIQYGFRRAPLFMLVSERKLRKSVNFLAKEVGLGPEEFSREPRLLMYSLEKRVMPRFEVLKALRAEGLVKEVKEGKKAVVSFFTYSERRFLQKYVEKYRGKAPELMDMHLSKLGGVAV